MVGGHFGGKANPSSEADSNTLFGGCWTDGGDSTAALFCSFVRCRSSFRAMAAMATSSTSLPMVAPLLEVWGGLMTEAEFDVEFDVESTSLDLHNFLALCDDVGLSCGRDFAQAFSTNGERRAAELLGLPGELVEGSDFPAHG